MEIPPELQATYKWDFEDKDETCIVKFQLPPHINTSAISVKLEENQSIEVSLPSSIPFLSGQLFNSVSQIQEIFNETILELILTKESPQDWPYPIIGRHPTTQLIDPQSAFIFSMSNQSHPSSGAFLQETIRVRYLPALLFAISQLTSPEQAASRKQLILLAIQYQSNEAYFFLAIDLLQNQGTMNEALSILVKLSSAGFIPAKATLGNCLSPFSVFPCLKDGEKAVQLLEDVLKNHEDPLAMYELSKLLRGGYGSKDLNRADELLEKAKLLNPEIFSINEPPIPKIETSNGSFFTSRLFFSCVGGVALAGIFIFSYIKSKKK